MSPSLQVRRICIVAGVLIAVFNPLGRVPAAGRGRSFKGVQQDGRSCAGSRTPACLPHPRALTAGVGEAPRHEIAGCGSPTVQRAMGN